MKRLIGRLKALIRNQSGATAIEYALICTAIFLAIVAPMAEIASKMDATYDRILNYFNSI